MRLIYAGESTASRRRLFFQLVGTDGLTPANAEAGGQPQVSLDGAAWDGTLISTLLLVGNGRYYADLTSGAVATAGTQIESRYKSAGTAECPGDSAQVVSFNPYHFQLPGDGLDLIAAETGVNFRQAQSLILAAAAGTLAGAGTGTILIKGASTIITRISATTDNAGNRYAVTLTLPS